MTISIRRFFARPSAVPLETTGWVSPNPVADIMFWSTPFEARYRTTSVARAVESSQLDGKRAFSSGPIGTSSV